MPIVFHVSVAIQQDGAEDPIRELLQVYDQLLPQVPRWAEPVLPVLSNLASITDATFTLFAYSADDEFASPGQLGWKAAGHYASATTRQLGKLLGHSDMFGNPLGLVNRIQDAGKQVGQHVEAGIKQGELTELGKGAAELTQGLVGGTAEFVGKLGRSALRLMAATGVVSQRTRQLVAQERPRTVLDSRARKVRAFADLEDGLLEAALRTEAALSRSEAALTRSGPGSPGGFFDEP